jgi:Tol biopolymer transport system component
MMSGAPGATAIHLLNLNTHESSLLDGSEGLYCPRWSPNGRYISATRADGLELMLFDSTTGKWTELTELSGDVLRGHGTERISTFRCSM